MQKPDMLITSVSKTMDSLPASKLTANEIMVRLHSVMEPLALIPQEFRCEEVNQAIDRFLQIKRDAWGK